MAIKFDISNADNELIGKIVRRAASIMQRLGHQEDFDRASLRMDLTCVQANGAPLRLADLLAADDFNFTHDVFGIRRHLDRTTGELTDHFSPRFSKRLETVEE